MFHHGTGLIKFLTPYAKAQQHIATLGLFNDPNSPSRIPTILQATVSHDNSSSNIKATLFPYVTDIKISGGLGNPAQGEKLVDLLFATCDEVALPIGNPAAMPLPGTDVMKGTFSSLNVGLYGPTLANVLAMQAKPDDSINSNRSSTIMTFASKKPDYDGFNILFTGDAHDRLPHAKDIRGNTFSLFNKQHFLVMKCPHHGSSDSNDEGFHLHYTAQYYLIPSAYKVHGYVCPLFGLLCGFNPSSTLNISC